MGKEVKNPCISLCKLDNGQCVGCGRTKDEIRKWKRMKRAEKKAVVEMATARLKDVRKIGKR